MTAFGVLAYGRLFMDMTTGALRRVAAELVESSVGCNVSFLRFVLTSSKYYENNDQ